MSQGCLGCSCSTPAPSGSGSQLLLATSVEHTVQALRSIAGKRAVAVQVLAPGLLRLDTADGKGFLGAAVAALSSVEAAEVRCLVLDGSLDDTAVLAKAMTAPALAVAGARVVHADLLPLFADEHARFRSVYQPIVELRGGRTIGYEALLRADTPEGVPVTPDVLFPAAEAAGWTHLLDRIGRTTALRGAGEWLGDQQLFINFIPTSIYRPEVCLRTTELAAQDSGVALEQIVFEVTEGYQLQDLDHLERVFGYYRSRGCKVALDDLGSGYSSLNMLVRLQPDIVKLDKDVVQSLPSKVGNAVVSAIVGITHGYGGLVLAECVETAEQAEISHELGVDLGQGWFFGRPEGRTSTAASRPLQANDPSNPDPAVGLIPQQSNRHDAGTSSRLS
jgi:EAL domain-containing protein (putative c-di-GMP-specific phosphodiesterase class I)